MTRHLIRATTFAGTALLVFFLSVWTTPAAQTTPDAAVIVGAVKDEHGASVVGAEVRAESLASGRALTTRTDDAGRYELKGLAHGAYRVSVSAHGFASVSRTVTLRRGGNGSDATAAEDFLLVPGAVEAAVTVTAGKGAARVVAETPQTVTVGDASRAEARRPASTLQLVEHAPNLTPVTANPALERPRLRGLASNRLLIILDGERLNNVRSDPTSGVSPSVVDVTQLASAEVVAGAGSSLYGSDAMSGVVNLITHAPVLAKGRERVLGLRFDGDARTNGRFRRASAVLDASVPRLAFRFSGSLFRAGEYTSGDEAITLAEVVRLGSLATEMSNAGGGGVARTYAVWSLPANAKIPNGQARGFNDRLDLWYFPRASHSVRYRQLNSQHKDLGFAFIAPPYDQRTQFNSFRRLDKYGLRYEARELGPWLPRLAVSFYRQKYSFPDDTITSPINADSSWTLLPNPAEPQSPFAVLTGRASAFTDTSFTDNKNSITTHAFDAQATLAPFSGTLFTTGVGYLRDSSRDEFSRVEFVPGTRDARTSVAGRASNPDSVYRNWGWFNLVEYEPARWLRLTAGLRVDNWRTEARATQGFPLGNERAIFEASFAQLAANPGQIDTEGAAGVEELLDGAGSITTSRTVTTGNVGAVVRLASGVNPYFRWGNSYREPGITERYLFRDFGDPAFSVLVVPNARLKPERGRGIEAGVKVQRARLLASIGYFRNDLTDFIGNAFADPVFVPADPARGLAAVSPFFPFHGVLYVQRANTARARIQGVEASYEFGLPLGERGVVTPFGAMGWLKGSNLTPDETTLALIGEFYNRDDTAIPLRGSATDAPLTGITPFRFVGGARYDSPGRRWFGEYETRYQARVRRVDPQDLVTAISTQYGSLASLDSFARHTLRGGYTLRREHYRASFMFGLENLTDRLYFEHFQTAPAPGRTLVFGLTLDLFDLLRK